MSDWTPRIVILVLFALILGVPFLFRPAEAEAPPDAVRLVIITPHNEQIRGEIARAFSEWHVNEFGRPVVIDWRAMGGTSDIHRILASGFAALDDMDTGVGYDIVFGGGDYFFGKQLTSAVRGESILAPIDFDDAFIADVYPEAELAGKKLYDAEHRQWWGVVLSSFGIVYNRDVYANVLEAEYPKTWSDLTDDSLAGWVGMGDPSHSGSVRVTYEAILQRYGWERGWKTLRRMCANAKYFSNSSSKVPIDVSQGEAAAGVSIDFYGRFQAEAIGDDRLGFISPEGSTVVTADPVAILRGANDPELAKRFVRFLLSRSGQSVWAFRAGEEGGPVQYELRRPPIRVDMYDEATMAKMRDAVNPFELARELEPDTPSYFSILPTALESMAMHQHAHLKRAWRAIRETDDPAKRRQMEAIFDELPFTQEELLAAPARWKADRRAKTEDRLAWTRFFAERYDRVIEMAE